MGSTCHVTHPTVSLVIVQGRGGQEQAAEAFKFPPSTESYGLRSRDRMVLVNLQVGPRPQWIPRKTLGSAALLECTDYAYFVRMIKPIMRVMK